MNALPFALYKTTKYLIHEYCSLSSKYHNEYLVSQIVIMWLFRTDCIK